MNLAPAPVPFPTFSEDLYARFRAGTTLNEHTWEQHRFHEARRWSALDFLDAIDPDTLSPGDRIYAWNAGRAELTTKPGADRLARQSDAECRRWQPIDPALASVLQACGTWSRYWNEEEAFHETALNRLATVAGQPQVSDEMFIEFRKIFPDDDMLRTLVLLAFSEITATINYACCAQHAANPALKQLFRQIAADEMQHMNYFITFAKALVDSGQYAPVGAFAIGHLFLKDDGEVQGSHRKRVVARDTHVNWWDHLEAEGVPMPDDIPRKQALILTALRRITGIRAESPAQVEDIWMDLVGC